MITERIARLSNATLSPRIKLQIVRPGDFIRSEIIPINYTEILKYNYIPYCLDFSNKEIIYTIGVNPINASEAIFHYLHLRDNTRKIASIPWDARIREGLKSRLQPVFIFSPGRCGSTLMSNLLRSMGAVSISEPDFYTQATSHSLRRLRYIFNPIKSTRMLPFLTEDLLTPLLGQSKPLAAIKMRSQVNANPKVVLSVCDKNPKTIFIIRHFHEWAESSIKTLGASLDSCLLSYIQSLKCYQYLRANSNCLLIKYEDLHKENTTLLDHISRFLSLSKQSDLSAVFDIDSQKGTVVAKERNNTILSSQMKENIRRAWKNNMPANLINTPELNYLRSTS